ncbi:MAG: L-threonylcarbamoyladenylate synthase [Candidatus Aminicenantales bacterium]
MEIKTRVIRIKPGDAHQGRIDEVLEVLRQDELIVYPTDTFYGLGACAYSPSGVEKVYRIKRRDMSKPLPVAVADEAMLEDVAVRIPPLARVLAARFWPGPLMLVLKASYRIPEEICGPSGTVGVRCPAHAWTRALLKHAGFPITATSANISGTHEIADPEEALSLFRGKVSVIIHGGKTQGTAPSTVVDVSGKKPVILREGAVAVSRLKPYLPEDVESG